MDTTCGALTEPGDAEAVAAALRNLMQDPSWRGALGAADPIRAVLLCDPARQLNAAAATLSTGGGEAWPADGLGPADDRRGDSLCWIARHGFSWTDRLSDGPTCLD